MNDEVHHIGLDAAKVKAQAWEVAQGWVIGHTERYAEVRRRKDNKLMLRYWFDQYGLQYMKF
ncbi:MAG: hypothetical protein A4E20_01505 [Nitrospira sp. SG-bin2]|uniref:hypothetical protein n=1 Tax=Nitrospira cf. moscoviensis SBR1015 TaxID=96242 RepID=UPI000A0EBF73|nr:hypothetical protein [Nitrospira cf. moscoviensis SBR1015]OQW34881.1 MAG: hypothetical protein A4E20_01505 [Nitrospira sp. SG-bin2]